MKYICNIQIYQNISELRDLESRKFYKISSNYWIVTFVAGTVHQRTQYHMSLSLCYRSVESTQKMALATKCHFRCCIISYAMLYVCKNARIRASETHTSRSRGLDLGCVLHTYICVTLFHHQYLLQFIIKNE